MSVPIQLSLTDGIVKTSNSNLLIVNSGAATLGGSSNSYIDGPFRKIGMSAYTFHIGDGSTYAPISISAPALATDAFTTQYFEIDPDGSYDNSLKDVSLDHISGCEYWILDRTNGASNVNITLSWDTRSCGITNISELAIARWDGALWKDHGNGGTTGAIVAGTITTAAAVTSFSPFTLASTTLNNPLPIQLVSFNATLNNNNVDLNWQTASEINNAYFTLEKSKDALNWEVFAEQNGAGNSNSILNYTDVDNNPFKGVSYYRLKQTDFDGKFEYSTIVTVNNLKEGIIAVYPNPVKDILTITNITKQHHVKVYASNGQLIYNGNTTTINTSNWSVGLYQVVITDATGKVIEKVKVVK